MASKQSTARLASKAQNPLSQPSFRGITVPQRSGLQATSNGGDPATNSSRHGMRHAMIFRDYGSG